MDEHGRIDEQRLTSARPFDIAGCRKRLAAAGGGYEVVHRSAGLEVGVYILVWLAEPDRQQPHEDDEVYVVLEGHRHVGDRGRADGG